MRLEFYRAFQYFAVFVVLSALRDFYHDRLVHLVADHQAHPLFSQISLGGRRFRNKINIFFRYLLNVIIYFIH
jgi:hypothetical protein